MPLSNVPSPGEGPVHSWKTVEDGVIASSLITAPAWGAWLSELNEVLTTLSLLIGLTLGLYRLWRIYQRNCNNKPPSHLSDD